MLCRRGSIRRRYPWKNSTLRNRRADRFGLPYSPSSAGIRRDSESGRRTERGRKFYQWFRSVAGPSLLRTLIEGMLLWLLTG